MSVVPQNRCKRLNHLDQNGTVEGVWSPNARRVVTRPPGVEQAANGPIVCTRGRWEVLHRLARGNYKAPVISITVDDLAATRRELEGRGVEFLTPIFDTRQGHGWTYLRAPDGNVYQIQGPYQQ